MAGSYPTTLLATGVNDLGRFDQFDLYAGESDIVTGQAQAADGQAIRQLEVLTFDDDGRLIPWGATGEHASGTITFTGQPTAAQTVTINGVVINFVSTITSGIQVLIGDTAAETVANLVDLINGTPDGVDTGTNLPTYGTAPLAGTGVTASVDTTGLIVTLHATVLGTGGNAITLAESASNVAVSGSGTLTGAEADHATGTLTFGAIAVNNQTITINGSVVTWKTSGAATDGSEANIGASATDSAQNLKAVINDFPGLFEVTASGSANVLALTAIPEGQAGNLITLAKSNTVPTLSGATLTGGAVAEPDFSRRPIGIAAQPVSAATPGTWLPYFNGGVFNHEALIWPASVATLAQRKRAVAGTDIRIGQLL